MAKKKKIKFIAFSCGYVESCNTSIMVYGPQYSSQRGYDSPAEAITELALDLFAKFESERPREAPRSCCENYRAKHKDYEHCPKCGRSFTQDGFDVYGFTEFVTNLHGATADSYGEAEFFGQGDEARDAAFWPWCFHEFLGADKSEVVWIAENAERVLLAALLDAKPDLKKWADEEIREGDSWSADWEREFKKGKQSSYR